MQSVVYFCWLAGLSTGGLVYLWPVTLFIVALFVTCVVTARRHQVLPAARRSWILLGAAPVAMLVWGTVFRNSGDFGTKHLAWQIYTLWFMMLAMLPVVALVIWRSRGRGWYVVGAGSLIVSYYTFWVMYVSVLSVTGNWL